MRAGLLAVLSLALLTLPALAGCFADGGSDGDGSGNPFVDRNGSAKGGVIDPGWPALEDATIRPGVQVVSATGQCTSNFVYQSPDNRTLYLGIAAHCVEQDAIGDALEIAGGAATGVLAYSSWHTMDELGLDDAAFRETNDFALVAIPDEHRALVHPAVLHFGGPTALATAPAVGDRVVTYGNTGLRQGIEETNRREGVVVQASEWYTSMYIASPGLPGDSGSGVLTKDGAAFGVLIHLQIAPTAGGNGAVNLAPALQWMRENTEVDATLATWSVLESGALP